MTFEKCVFTMVFLSFLLTIAFQNRRFTIHSQRIRESRNWLKLSWTKKELPKPAALPINTLICSWGETFDWLCSVSQDRIDLYDLCFEVADLHFYCGDGAYMLFSFAAYRKSQISWPVNSWSLRMVIPPRRRFPSSFMLNIPRGMPVAIENWRRFIWYWSRTHLKVRAEWSEVFRPIVQYVNGESFDSSSSVLSASPFRRH